MTQQEKPEFIFVVDDKIGGVAYLNKNLVNNATSRGNARIKVILVRHHESTDPKFPDTIDADEIVPFVYSSVENKYAVLKRLHTLFGTSPGAIICNEGLEMEAIYVYGTTKTVYQLIHDFYNIRLAVKYGAIADVFVSHTKLFCDVVLSAAPAVIQSFHLNHGVTIPVLQTRHDRNDRLRLVFTGRLVEQKGVHELFVINELLKERKVEVQWTIIGRGPLQQFLEEQWKAERNISFISPDTNEEVLKVMGEQDLFILPTRFEGSPVTMLEALATGLVPVISDLPGGIREIVTDQVGRRIPIGDVQSFAESIIYFHHNRDRLVEMSGSNRQLAIENFDIRKTAVQYFNLFADFRNRKKQKLSLAPISIGFRLDHKWLPNVLVSFLRRIKKNR